jgi:gamma-glutamylcyclotransferase (GGCT)/AIG2-like uncharacterized protein YtfP
MKEPDDFPKFAINFCDGIIAGNSKVKPELLDFARSKTIPVLDYIEESDVSQRYADFYDSILEK